MMLSPAKGPEPETYPFSFKEEMVNIQWRNIIAILAISGVAIVWTNQPENSLTTNTPEMLDEL